MACCGGGGNEAVKSSKRIDDQLRKDKNELESEVRLLLLGAGESGKSTIVKQMKIIHQEGYTQDELLAFKSVVYGNVIGNVKALVSATKKFNFSFDSEDNERRAEDAMHWASSGNDFNVSMGNDIMALWGDSGVQQAFQRASEFQLGDSARYYLDEMRRLSQPDYVPNVKDVLYSRVRTTGIVETEFKYSGIIFKLFDVGGQRNERKKWIHCFQGITAVIFVAAISEYDQKLFEDDQQNRLTEALLLFDEICNSVWFQDTAMILFLNKIDLFKAKIEMVDLRVCFPEYNGGQDYDSSTAFIQQRFEELNKNESKTIYTHMTNATDTENIRFVFNAVKDIILQNCLKTAGFV